MTDNRAKAWELAQLYCRDTCLSKHRDEVCTDMCFYGLVDQLEKKLNEKEKGNVSRR